MTLREFEQGVGTGEVGRHYRSGWRGQAALGKQLLEGGKG
jgi:hypothetical protein